MTGSLSQDAGSAESGSVPWSGIRLTLAQARELVVQGVAAIEGGSGVQAEPHFERQPAAAMLRAVGGATSSSPVGNQKSAPTSLASRVQRAPTVGRVRELGVGEESSARFVPADVDDMDSESPFLGSPE